MPFSSLHFIEVQLVAHLLDATSLLRFARCDRFTLQAASCAFAFRHQPPFEVCSLQPDLPSLLCGSLLRFARIHLEWVDRLIATADEPLGMDALLASLLPLDSLTITSFDTNVSRFTLDSDMLQSLRSFRTLRPFSSLMRCPSFPRCRSWSSSAAGWLLNAFVGFRCFLS